MKTIYSSNEGAEYIFIIDDDMNILESLEKVFGNLGYRVFSYSNPIEFLSTSENYVPAVIITDMRMPEMSGVELQAKLNEIGRATPLIFITAESTLQESVNAMKQGAFEFLIKPFQMPSLLKAIRVGLEKDKKRLVNLNHQILRDEKLKKLTKRESEVCELIVKGFSIPKMAETLLLSIPTVKQYKAQIHEKLGTSCLSELISFCSDHIENEN